MCSTLRAAMDASHETDSPHAEVERLRRAALVFDQEPEDMPWLWREARFRDPDGHHLCLFHAGANRPHPPWRLDQPAAQP